MPTPLWSLLYTTIVVYDTMKKKFTQTHDYNPCLVFKGLYFEVHDLPTVLLSQE